MKKIAVVTGAASGIGAAIARALSKQLYDLVLVGRNVEALSAAAGDIKSQTPECQVLCQQADLTNAEDREAILDCFVAEGYAETLLVNNAGISLFGTISSHDHGNLEALFTTNTIAPMELSRLFIRQAIESGKVLSVINIGSTFGSIGYPGFSGYCASKFALRGFSEALSRELADVPAITVRYFAPRATKTGFNTDQINRMNAELGVSMDTPETVAAEFMVFLKSGKTSAHVGWPERFFVWLNKVAPQLVENALSKQLPVIKKYATG